MADVFILFAYSCLCFVLGIAVGRKYNDSKE